MRVIPVDAGRFKVLVVGEPTAQMRDGQAVRNAPRSAQWNLDVTLSAKAGPRRSSWPCPREASPKESVSGPWHPGGDGGGHLGEERPFRGDGPGQVDQGRGWPGRIGKGAAA